MSFDRQKRLLLAGLAWLAPIPLPFNEVVGWPSVLLFWLGLGLFLRRTWRDEATPLPTWAMNLLGLAYLPFLLFDFGVLWQGRLLRPLAHLALFTLAVKLFGMRREKDKWHILLLIFFIFVAAMGTSVHPAVVMYLLAFLGGGIMVLARFATLHVLSSHQLGGVTWRAVPMRGPIATCTLLTAVLAIPLFALLPRLGRPYVVGPGGGSSTVMGGAGLMERISLDVIGRIRTSRAVAMRVSYENPPPSRHEMRFRDGAYSRFDGTGWQRGQRRTRALRKERDGFFHVASGIPRSWMKIWLEPAAGSGVVLPVEAVAVDLWAPAIHLDQFGLVSVLFRGGRTLDYRVGMAAEPGLVLAEASGDGGLDWEADGLGVVSPPIATLAEEVAGPGSATDQARSIESFLQQEYEYTLNLVGQVSDRPVEDFLFRWRRGHCELFASAMVLMLRSRGIPARLVTGYLGGEYSPFEGYYVVRQSDAHAWVEAHLPVEGWQTFDPTPNVGRPSARSSGWSHLLAQAWDYMLFRWDRYVLTYGLFDQVGFARRLLSWWSSLRRSGPSDEGPSGVADTAEASEVSGPESEVEITVIEAIPIALLVLLVGLWIWLHRPPFSAARAYRRLRARAEREAELAVHDSVPPLGLAVRIAKARPTASSPSRRVIELYLRESFGGQDLTEPERLELRAALREAVENLRRTA